MLGEPLEEAQITKRAIAVADRVVPMTNRVTWDKEQGYFVNKSGKIWIPEGARDLQQRLCIIAHQGAAGHRGVSATTDALLSKFDWKSARADVKTFIQGCLHCLCIDGEVVPRPRGSALHAGCPNELIHFDWLQLPLAENGWHYVLVMKDDMSGFCRLFPSQSVTAGATADALMEWFTTHGTVLTWVSDGGSHFKNEVIHKIKKLLGAHHHIMTPHTPWANDAARVKFIAELRVSLDRVHRDVIKLSKDRREKPREHREMKKKVKLAKSALGDFVLVAKVVKFPNKLALNWRGPARVVRAVSDYLMEVEQLVEPYDVSLHHASRLKMYAEGGLEVTDDLVQHIAYGDEGFYVEDLVDLRCNDDGKYELLVKWMGLDRAEASWEPTIQLYEDIPVILRRWIKSRQSEAVVAQLQRSLEEHLWHSL
ncbi:hypothetical protein THRCLA_06835 [Thraustotheca clavata]|uniref:Chromo domain-containing protein n=1 Tax=Thraustotheca clavata TaxID=74557 RepID=A0A1V9ZIT5_9STRA|nr:hypothetical protein THRCLA_06835 [Thraustotheca clavata]